jgi:predicted transcriptional regulator
MIVLLSDGSKFYSKSLTLLVRILELINEEFILIKIAKVLNMEKSHVSYYIGKAKRAGFVKEVLRDRIKILELTQVGKNFLDQYKYKIKYNNPSSSMQQLPCCRAENIRFKACVYKLPSKPLDWNKVTMNNWKQYNNIVDNIRVHLNDGKSPSIEFIPSPIDGENPWELFGILYNDCNEVARKLEQLLDMEIGRLELEPGAEWVVYDPLAKLISRYNGQITLNGFGKINASKPFRRGEIEFFDPRFAADYISMPKRISNIEKLLEDFLKGNKEDNEVNSIDQKVQEVELNAATAEQLNNKDRNSHEETS